MPKVITPAFPPRRPARYLLIAVGILALLYLHRNLSPTLNAPVEQVQSVPHLPHRPPSPDPALTAPGQEFIVDGKPADINGPKSEEPPAADADTDTDTDESTPDAPDAEKSQKPQAWAKDPFYDGFDDGFSDGPSDSLDETLTSSGSSSDSSSSNSGSSDSSSSDSSSPKSSSPKSPSKSSSHSSQEPPPGPKDSHPIDRLVYDAQHTFAEIISRQSNTLEDAAQAYRKRRGRHPPPGFDAWFKFAQSRGAIIVEDFFDQIYHDLEPFWGLPPAVLRKESWDFEMTIHIRNGKATTSSDWFWTVIWLDLIQSIEHLLPDMDISLNPMDEPRIIVPWEEMEKYMSDAKKTVQLPKAKTVRRQFQQLPEPGYGDLEIETRKKDFETAGQ